MEQKSKKGLIKQIAIITAMVVCTLALITAFSFGMYKVFTNFNNKELQTISRKEQESNAKEQEGEEVVQLIEPETIEEPENEEEKEENEESEEEKEPEEQLTEEEKQKREEARKKQEEERKKREEEARKAQAQRYPYWIKVNCAANTVTVYGKDADGNYNVPIKAMVCSIGSSTPRSGVYKTPQKSRWGVLIGPVWGQYCTRITGQILFHSVPYLKKEDPSSLEYWEYDRLGEQRSLGCIRLTVADAKWIFDNCPLGTSVEFYSSSNPGPLGKPGIQRVSAAGDPYRGWDPTDPNPNNPWRTKAQQEAKKKAEEEAKKKAEEEAKKKAAEEEAKKEAEEEAKKKAEEEARKKAEEEAKTIVPDVVGKTESEARSLLKNFTVIVDYTTNNSKANGIVLQQNPAAKSKAQDGKVKLIVNKVDTSVAVPNVIGMSETAARNALKDFKVSVKTVSVTSGTNGVVSKQNPTYGTKAEKGSTVTITVNKLIPTEDNTENNNSDNNENNNKD